jgi:AcrR family transcriptional regulator
VLVLRSDAVTREGGSVATRLSTARAGGDQTRTKILEATLQTLREVGIVGATARAIGRTGGFNQALIFYHFGGVTELLVAAAVYEGEQRAARYQAPLEAVSTLPQLVAVARELHEEEVTDGGLNVLTQLLAGAASSPALRAGLVDAFRPWRQFVEQTVERVLAGTPYAGVVKTEDLSFAITSLFLGVEMMHTLEPETDAAQSLFGTFEMLASVIEVLLRGSTAPPAAAPAKKTAKRAPAKK